MNGNAILLLLSLWIPYGNSIFYDKMWLTYSGNIRKWLNEGHTIYVQMHNCTVEDNFVLWTWIKMYRTMSKSIPFILIVYLEAFLHWSLITGWIYLIPFQKITPSVKVSCEADRGSITDTYTNFFVHKHVCFKCSCPPGSSYIFITRI